MQIFEDQPITLLSSQEESLASATPNFSRSLTTTLRMLSSSDLISPEGPEDGPMASTCSLMTSRTHDDDNIGARLATMEESDVIASAGSAELALSNCHAAKPPVTTTSVTGKNNSSQDASDHMTYSCPSIPEGPCDIGIPEHVTLHVASRMAMRPDRNKYVTLNFRVMRRDVEMHVGEILLSGTVRRSELYTPRILDRWTLKLRIKMKSMVKVSSVFKSISARLGLQCTIGLKYCLDGFYGVKAFGDAFGNFGDGICPWMEVAGDGTPLSLKLKDSDNIYISMATEKMVDLVRLRIQRVSEQMMKQSQRRSQRQPVFAHLLNSQGQ